MAFLRETTVWPNGGRNHTYLLTPDRIKMLAYVKEGEKEVFTFKKPIPFYTRGRLFVEVPNTFGYKIKDSTPAVKIKGSTGTEYVVSKQNDVLKCSCPGFSFRGKCKHLEEGALLLSKLGI